MRYVILALLFLAVSQAQAQNVDRYWGEFEIARVRVTALPFDGGAGRGIGTNWVPIYAQAIVRVEEAQNFTWEWIGLTSPGEMALEGFPNLTFDASSDDTFEFTELKMDLNPIAPNIWGSAEVIELPYPELTVTGSYSSFSTSTDFDATFDLGNAVFETRVGRVDFRKFPEELIARVEQARNLRKEFELRSPPELEPKLQLGRLQVHQHRIDGTGNQCWTQATDLTSCGDDPWREVYFTHTPSGDANNDGTVDFSDFLILSGNFAAEAARWDDGDFDEDGDVDFSDFLSLSTNFNSNVAAVPEPSAGVLAMFAVVGLGLFRRRR